MPDAAPAPARPTVYLHLGTPKSGTTYLQNMLWKHREAIREQGVLYPGDAYPAHYWATLDLQDATYRDHAYPEVPGAWDRLVAEAADWDGRVVISHELLTRCTPEQAKRAVSSLDFADVHLVLTLRDLTRQIPAAWQETVKNRFDVSFAEFVAQLREPGRGDHGRAFWRMQDVADILRRWDVGVPERNVHLVTVPPPGGPRDLLWHRFAELAGIEHGRLPDPEVAGNTSVGAVEVRFLRLLNERLGERVEWPAYERVVKHGLVTGALAGREGARRIGLGGADRAWAAERAERMLAELSGRAYNVVGDLADLAELAPPAAAGGGQAHPDEVSADELVDVALDAAGGLVVAQAARQRGQAAEVVELRRRLARTEEELRIAYERPVLRHWAHRVGQRVPVVMRLLERLARRRAKDAGR